MTDWIVEFHDEFEREYEGFSAMVQVKVLAYAKMLKQSGPRLGRPSADTLNDSKHANMKELRFSADNGAWRVLYAFDPERKAILLVAGDKSGVSEDMFYRRIIKLADGRFDDHLAKINRKKGEK